MIVSPRTMGVTAFWTQDVVNGSLHSSVPSSADTPTRKDSEKVTTWRTPSISATTGEA